MDRLVLNPLPRKIRVGKIFPLYSILISHGSPNKKVPTMIFEEYVATQKKWHRSYSWQMTLRLGLSVPPCGHKFSFLKLESISYLSLIAVAPEWMISRDWPGGCFTLFNKIFPSLEILPCLSAIFAVQPCCRELHIHT